MLLGGLIILGLAGGSFINAFIWRFHSGRDWVRDRSECVNCHHKLSGLDLIPVFSWLLLRGKCRYCKQPISLQYPIVEAATAALFAVSYLAWPKPIHGLDIGVFSLWLVLLVGLVALAVYDLKWMLLPDKIVAWLGLVASVQAIFSFFLAANKLTYVSNLFFAILIGGGLFYILFQLSRGQWIGGGDVKLGFLLGLVAGTPSRSLLVIFLASLIGSASALPLLARQRLGRSSHIPFGPFLIVALIIVQLYGSHILKWYSHTLLMSS